MALDPYVLGEVYNSAASAIRQSGTQTDLGSLARELQGRYGLTSGAPYIDFLNAVMAADRNWRLATVSQEDPNYIERVRNIPVDPTITRGSGLIQYRVIVITTDENGRTAENRVVIVSPTSISGAQAVELAIEEVRSGRVVRTTNPRRDTTGSQLDYSGAVVSIGRAGN
jgi:hypothetical protein